MIRHWAYAVGAASLLAMLLAGCASGAAKGGPLASKVGGQLLECIPSSPDGLYTDGMTSLPNLSTNTAVIERITLIDAHNLRILSSWIVPAAGPVYGDIPGGYPPRSGGLPPPPGFDWAGRQRAIGATIPPTPSGGPEGTRPNVNLVIVMAVPPHGHASDRGMYVWYRLGGRQYRLHTTIWLWLRPGSTKACPKV